MESLYKKRAREEPEGSEQDLPEVKRLRDELLCFLDDSNPDTAIDDIDFVVRSLQDEISSATSSSSDSGESKPELDYLLEASDDELGLPPSVCLSNQEDIVGMVELLDTSPVSAGIGGIWEFEDFYSNDASFGSGNWFDSERIESEYVAVDELFEYPEFHGGSLDYSNFSRRCSRTNGDVCSDEDV